MLFVSSVLLSCIVSNVVNVTGEINMQAGCTKGLLRKILNNLRAGRHWYINVSVKITG